MQSDSNAVVDSSASEEPSLPKGVSAWAKYRLWMTIGVFLLALIIRLPGIGWGLKNDLHNQSYHPDEEVNWRASRRVEPLKLSFTPGFYSYGTLYLTAMRVADDASALVTPPQGELDTDWDFIARGELAGRLISTLSGAALSAVLFWLGTLILGEICGLMAGLIGAVAPGLVMHSRFATVDVFATLWIALVAVSAVRLLDHNLKEKDLWKHVLLAGLFAGCAAGTKYTGGAAILMAVVALALARPEGWLMKSAVAFLVTIGTFVATTPGILLDREAFWRDFKFEQAHVASGHGLVFVDTAPGYLFQLSNLFLVVGAISVLMGIGGLIWAMVRQEKWAYVVVTFAVAFYILIGGAAVKFARYCFPLVPALAVGAGYAVANGFSMGRRGAWLVAGGMLGVAGIPGQGGLIGTVTVTAAMLAEDSRDAGANELKKVATDTTSVGVPEDPWFWSVPLFPDATMIRAIPFRVRDNRRRQAIKPSVLQFLPLNTDDRKAWDVQLLTQLRPDYVAYSDLECFDLDRLANTKLDLPSDQAEQVSFYKAFLDELKKSYTPWQKIGPGLPVVEDLRYAQPTVYLWKRK